MFLHADSEDSDQTGRMSRLIRVFTGRTCHCVGFFMRRLKYSKQVKTRCYASLYSQPLELVQNDRNEMLGGAADDDKPYGSSTSHIIHS